METSAILCFWQHFHCIFNFFGPLFSPKIDILQLQKKFSDKFDFCFIWKTYTYSNFPFFFRPTQGGIRKIFAEHIIKKLQSHFFVPTHKCFPILHIFSWKFWGPTHFFPILHIFSLYMTIPTHLFGQFSTQNHEFAH